MTLGCPAIVENLSLQARHGQAIALSYLQAEQVHSGRGLSLEQSHTLGFILQNFLTGQCSTGQLGRAFHLPEL